MSAEARTRTNEPDITALQHERKKKLFIFRDLQNFVNPILILKKTDYFMIFYYLLLFFILFIIIILARAGGCLPRLERALTSRTLPRSNTKEEEKKKKKNYLFFAIYKTVFILF